MEQIEKIINDFDTPQTRRMLIDMGVEVFREKFLAIATNLDLSDVDDPKPQPVFINHIDQIVTVLCDRLAEIML